MKRYLWKIAAAVSFALLAPMFSEGQNGLFDRDPNAAIYRKARSYNLVSVERTLPEVFIDMRYKITSAAGRPLYRNEMPCLIHRSTADKLKVAAKALRADGYAIKIWDAWRPPEAHQALWDAVKDPNYVVPPSKGLSWHCYGVSVDLTLVTLDGGPVEMPSKFDEFSSRAASTYTGDNLEIARRVNLLQKAMQDAGFRIIKAELWHFDYMNARGGIRNVTAADLGIAMP